MSLFKRLFGKKQKPVNTVINQPKFPGSTATFYYGGSHVAYDHREDYSTRDAQPPVYPWTEIGDQLPTPEHHTRDFGGYNGGDGGGAGASGSWESDSGNGNDYSPSIDTLSSSDD